MLMQMPGLESCILLRTGKFFVWSFKMAENKHTVDDSTVTLQLIGTTTT